jgi:hypothetical protein
VVVENQEGETRVKREVMVMTPGDERERIQQIARAVLAKGTLWG